MDTIVFLLILATLVSMRGERRGLTLTLFLAAIAATLLVFRHHVTDALPLSF